VPNINIAPQTVLLTMGQAVTFEATDASGQPLEVNWSLNPQIGNLAAPASGNQTPGLQASSIAYVAPQILSSAQTIAIIASKNNESASATISLTSDAIAIVPVKVELKAKQSQQFLAIVAGASGPTTASAQNITWIVSPPLGSVESTGLYTAPAEIPDSTTVNVIATSSAEGKQAVATVSLTSPPWQGPGVNALGGFLLLVFSLVFLMVMLWPPALPSPDAAKTNRMEAEKTWQEKTDALKKEITAAKALDDRKPPTKPSPNKVNPGAATSSKTPSGTNNQDQNAEPADGQNPVDATNQGTDSPKGATAELLQQMTEDQSRAYDDLKKKHHIEDEVNNTEVKTKLPNPINRELDLLLLVLLAGALGSFLHMAQSYSEYIGNRKLKSSWVWWYCLGPFIGAGLALVFYAAVRGGFMAIGAGSNVKASEMNPFGLVSVAALVGMFSKDATMKLGELFDTLFKSDKDKYSKDKLSDSSKTSNQPAKSAPDANAGQTTAK
jgi:hypothetical protein